MPDTPSSLFLKHPRPHLLVFFVYLLLPILFQLEVFLSPARFLISGQQCAGYTTWQFWWLRHALSNGLDPFYSFLVMYPSGVPIFSSAPLLDFLSITVFRFLEPIVLANAVLLFSKTFAAIAAYTLCFHITKDTLAAFLTGFLYAFSTYMLAQHFHGVADLSLIGFLPLYVLALLRIRERRSPKNIAVLCAVTLSISLLSPYIMFSFLFVFLLGSLSYFIFSNDGVLTKETLRPLGWTLALAMVVAGVCNFPILRYRNEWMGGSYFYSTYVGSLLSPPNWFGDNLLTSLSESVFGNMGFPEERMAYLGIFVTMAMIICVLKKKWLIPKYRFWMWIAAFSLVLVLGPTLCWSTTIKTQFPLPYAIFQHLPLFGLFRNTGRTMMTTTLACALLTGFIFLDLTKQLKKSIRFALVLLLVAWTIYELGLHKMGTRYLDTRPSGAYQAIKADPDNFAILALPSIYDQEGNMHHRQQIYMMLQTFHQKALILGFLPRHTANSLHFTDTTDGIYELTHPQVLLKLEQDPSLAARVAYLTKNARRILEAHKIKYVVLHSRMGMLEPSLQAALERWTVKFFGKPILIDQSGVSLFHVYEN